MAFANALRGRPIPKTARMAVRNIGATLPGSAANISPEPQPVRDQVAERLRHHMAPRRVVDLDGPA